MANWISEERMEQLDRFSEMGKRVEAVIQNIKSGMTEAKACREADIRVSAFRTHTAKCQYIENSISKEEILSKAEFSDIFLHPAEKLYLLLIGESLNCVASVEDIPWGVEKSMEKVMHKALTKRQIKVIRCWIWERRPMAEIAKILGVTPDRVRQIITESIRRMRHPIYLRYFREGFAWAEKTDRIRMEKLDAIRRERLEVIEKEVQREKEKLDRPKPVVFETKITDCPLSARTCNALVRKGIKTLGDLEGKTDKDLMRIRNLGQKSMDELKAVYQDMVGEPMSELDEDNGQG